MNIKRMRGRGHRGNGGSSGGGGGGGSAGSVRHHSSNGGIPLNRNHVFDSTGPEQRGRGTAQQLYEKYLQHGRDATASGDRVMGEAYFQHAEHYFRIVSAMNQASPQGQGPGQPGYNGNQRRGGQQGEDQSQSNQDEAEFPNAAAELAANDMQDHPSEARQIPIAVAAPEV